MAYFNVLTHALPKVLLLICAGVIIHSTKMTAVEMKGYRKTVGKTRRDSVRNGKIRDELGQFYMERRLK